MHSARLIHLAWHRWHPQIRRASLRIHLATYRRGRRQRQGSGCSFLNDLKNLQMSTVERQWSHAHLNLAHISRSACVPSSYRSFSNHIFTCLKLASFAMIPERSELSVHVILFLFFLKRRQKLCLNLLIKKKRIVQLINRKPGKNRYNKTIRQQT
jgi:hypothetical protein